MSNYLKRKWTDGSTDAGKRELFSLVVEEEAEKVYNLAYRLCGNQQQARDLTQETFLRAWQSFERFEGRSAIFTYLYRITCNLWKNSLRRPAFHSLTREENPGSGPLERDIPDSRRPFSEEISRAETGEFVQECLLLLDPPERAIIILRDIEEKSHREIALVLRCREGTVKSRLARARRKLAGLIKERGEEEPT